MAAITHRVATADTAATSSITSGAFVPAVDDLLVVLVAVTHTASAGTMSDSAGGAWTKIASSARTAGPHTLYLWVRNSLITSASSMTVTFDFSDDAGTGAVIFVASVSGMSKTGATAVRQSKPLDNGTAGNTPAVTFDAAALTGNPTFGAVANAANPAGVTEPTGWAEQSDTGYASPTSGAEYVSRDSGFTGSTITWGSTSSANYSALIAELDASGGAPSTSPVMQPMGVQGPI